MESNNAKHFALQLGSLISLYVSIGALIQLLFGVITILIPDAANQYWEYESATGSIRIAIALLIVFFPAYIVLTRLINKGRRESGSAYLAFTKWLIYLSLLVGGLVILGDLVSVIYNFLNGELTLRFFLKALVILGVVGSACTYYIYDARGYWQNHEAQSKQYGLITSVIIIISIVFGFMQIEAPTQVRERGLDERQITDLQVMQSQILNYYMTINQLPASLDALGLSDTLPEAPEGRAAYTYTKTSETRFELCATFTHPSDKNAYPSMDYGYDTGIKNPYDWNHEAGDWCFVRVVNPSTFR